MRTVSLCTEDESLITRCCEVLQHKWDEAHLVGVSAAAKDFIARHEGEKITVLIHGARPLQQNLRLTEVTEK